jgi:hypothetical protein
MVTEGNQKKARALPRVTSATTYIPKCREDYCSSFDISERLEQLLLPVSFFRPPRFYLSLAVVNI